MAGLVDIHPDIPVTADQIFLSDDVKKLYPSDVKTLEDALVAIGEGRVDGYNNGIGAVGVYKVIT